MTEADVVLVGRVKGKRLVARVRQVELKPGVRIEPPEGESRYTKIVPVHSARMEVTALLKGDLPQEEIEVLMLMEEEDSIEIERHVVGCKPGDLFLLVLLAEPEKKEKKRKKAKEQGKKPKKEVAAKAPAKKEAKPNKKGKAKAKPKPKKDAKADAGEKKAKEQEKKRKKNGKKQESDQQK